MVLSAIALEAPSLQNAAAGRFEIGVGISDHIPQRTNDWPLLTAQFSTVTPENCMKPAAVQPIEGVFDFATADAFVDFATRQKLKLVGHCLVWAKDDRTPAWFYRDGQQPASREHGLNPPAAIFAFENRVTLGYACRDEWRHSLWILQPGCGLVCRRKASSRGTLFDLIAI